MAKDSELRDHWENTKAEISKYQGELFGILGSTIISNVLLMLGDKMNFLVASVISLTIGFVSLIALFFLKSYLKEFWGGKRKVTLVLLVMLASLSIPLLINLSQQYGEIEVKETEISNIKSTQLIIMETLSAFQSTPSIFYSQSKITLYEIPGDETSVIATIPECDVLNFLQETPLRETIWVEVFSQNVRKRGWVKKTQILNILGICPSPTLMPTITMTPSITQTPTLTPTNTLTPTFTPTPTKLEFAYLTIENYFKFIEQGDGESLSVAWSLLHNRFQTDPDVGGYEGWKYAVENNNIWVDLDRIKKELIIDGNTAETYGDYLVSPNELEAIPNCATFYLVYNIDKDQWYITRIHLNEGVCDL